MKKIKIKAYAKINLSLDIVGKFENGYHDLCMVMQNVDLCDDVEMEVLDGNNINISTNDKTLPVDQSNIAYRAAELFFRYTNKFLGINIFINKRIPKEAGLGGGSADAAAVLVGLNILSGNLLSNKKLEELGAQLGADVPFFMTGGTAVAEGIGTKLTKLETPKLNILIVKPPGGISTKEAYNNFDISRSLNKPNNKELIKAISENRVENITKFMGNVLYDVSSKILPEIKTAVDFVGSQRGCERAMMTGSGSTVFGIFNSESNLKCAEIECKKIWENVYKVTTVNYAIVVS